MTAVCDEQIHLAGSPISSLEPQASHQQTHRDVTEKNEPTLLDVTLHEQPNQPDVTLHSDMISYHLCVCVVFYQKASQEQAKKKDETPP